ncbi:MAG: PilN domain-containing protein [Deltaproteobacteria bacterium]|nr:PilN domain-containing protein [Deltaproteobacteria bacterium]
MIRINLLQVRAARERERSSAATQLLLFLALVVAEVGVLVFLTLRLSDQVATKNEEVQSVRATLNTKRSQIADFEAKKAELQQISGKKQVIEGLRAARTGPKHVLAEVMRMLSKGRGPALDEATQALVRQQPEQNYHREWDYRRLWLRSFAESDRQVTIAGSALDVQDIGEFQRRLNLSQYFDEVRWVSSPEAKSGEGEESRYDFTLKARAVYQ